MQLRNLGLALVHDTVCRQLRKTAIRNMVQDGPFCWCISYPGVYSLSQTNHYRSNRK